MYATEEERIKALRASRYKYHKIKNGIVISVVMVKITQLEEKQTMKIQKNIKKCSTSR